MATTKLLAYKTSDEADNAVGFYTSLGYSIARVGPTDRIEMDGGSPTSIVWDSGIENDWTIIIATKDGIIT